MPESKVRKTAAEKKKHSDRTQVAEKRAAQQRHTAAPGSRGWVVPTFITLGLLGVLWLVVYYIAAAAQITVPGITALGGWNVLVGMVLMGSAFGVATLWK